MTKTSTKKYIKKNIKSLRISGEKAIKNKTLFIKPRSFYSEIKSGLGSKIILDIPEVKKGYFLRKVKVKNPNRKHLWTYSDGKGQVSFVFYKDSNKGWVFARMGEPFFSLPISDESLYRITLYYIYIKKHGKLPKGWASKKLRKLWNELNERI
jgi:hypothetical protein